MLQRSYVDSRSAVEGLSCGAGAYDRFNPPEPDTKSVSVMDEAKRLGDYIVEHYEG